MLRRLSIIIILVIAAIVYACIFFFLLLIWVCSGKDYMNPYVGFIVDVFEQLQAAQHEKV